MTFLSEIFHMIFIAIEWLYEMKTTEA